MNRALGLALIVGARPQFVKAAPLVGAAQASRVWAPPARPCRIQILHTGQHYDPDMDRVFFEEMELPEPTVNLGVGSASHGAMTGRMIERLEAELARPRPDLVLTLGDTNSTLAGALSAAQLGLPTAHIEAGMRSYDRRMPEEINRVVADHVSDLLFCSTASARDRLAAEGLTRGVHVVGDVMLDAFLEFSPRARPAPWEGPFLLLTLHRPGNVDDPARLRTLLAALANSPLPLYFPVHPRTRQRFDATGPLRSEAIRLTQPLSYLTMLGALKACSGLITDSGGLQKEAFFAGKRCLVLREETEWVELVELGTVRLVGADPSRIAEGLGWVGHPHGSTGQPFGDGRAAERILRIVGDYLSSASKAGAG